jgi:hypothetical protein
LPAKTNPHDLFTTQKRAQTVMTILHQSGAGSNTPRTALPWAETYAHAGARVLPLRPKQKVPGITDWPNKATTDPNQVQAWFSSGDNNLGLAMGAWDNHDTYLVCIDLDVHEADKNGVEAWQRLVAQHGDMGAPFIADTATGGMHLLYQTDVPLTNERGALPPGIDVRGCGGQIMVQPSTHPQGGTPKWRGNAWQEGEPGIMPQWLLELIQTQPTPVMHEYVKPVSHGDDTRPGDEYNRTHSWHQVLAADGWTDLGNNSWARPGKNPTEGSSASLGDHDVLTVFSTNAPAELLQQKFVTNTGGHHKFGSPWAYEVAMRHGGDFVQAARTYGSEHRQHDERRLLELVSADTAPLAPLPEFGLTYKLRQMSELVGVPHVPVIPTLLCYDGKDRGLFYKDAHNLVAAPGGIGKSWLQAITALQQIQRGNHAVIIDYEMNMRQWFDRLTALGATPTELDLLHYCQPGEALEMVGQYGARAITKAHTMLTNELQRIADMGTLTYVGIDGVTNAMSANSLKLLDNQDISQFWRLLPEHIVRNVPGCGVALNDHVAKGAREGDQSPIGGQHKVATTSGAVFIARSVSAMTKYPTPHDGVLLLRLVKDRYGEIGMQGNEVAQVILSPDKHGGVTYQVLPYTGDAAQAATGEREKVLKAITELNGQGIKATHSKVLKMAGMTNKTTLSTHLKVLEGQRLVQNTGGTGKHDWRALPPDMSGNDLDVDF